MADMEIKVVVPYEFCKYCKAYDVTTEKMYAYGDVVLYTHKCSNESICEASRKAEKEWRGEE